MLTEPMNAAFILNANAKRVNERLVEQIVDMVPAGDVFYSRSMQDSERYFRLILKRGYNRIFSGGGDGTIIHTINAMRRIAKEECIAQLPKIGVLKLGTGNALANCLGARSPFVDVNHVMNGGKMDSQSMSMVACDDGTLAPFAGMGWDGDMINDYSALKREIAGTPWEGVMKTVLGYVWAGVTKTLPRHLNEQAARIRVTTKKDAFKMVVQDGVDTEVLVPAGTVLYEGPSKIASVSTINCFGYGFKMFPFADRKPGFMHLRLSSLGFASILANLYPGVWSGTYRHPEIFDFLVSEIEVESDMDLAYQVAGDARGYRKKLHFGIVDQAVEMVRLSQERLMPKRFLGLLPAPVVMRS